MEFTEDLLNSVQSAVQEMEWEELASTLEAAIMELLGDTPTPPPPAPSPPPPVPAGLGELNTIPQPAESQDGVYGGCIPQGAAPQMMAAPTMLESQCQEDIMQPGHVYSQPGACSQGQYLPYQYPVADAQTAAAVGYPAAPQHPYNSVPVVRLCDGFSQNLHLVGMMNNGELLYRFPAGPLPPPVSAAHPPNTSLKKNKRANRQDDDRPYIKKPPNAFMLFLKEQRPKLQAELNSQGSAAVNKVLGQKWKSMADEEQAKYYEEAERERQLHWQTHPEWSNSDNYGKKRKRQRSKAPTRTKASAPDEDTQRAKKPCVTPAHTAMMEPSRSLTAVMEVPHTLTGVMEPPHPQSARELLTTTQAPPIATTWLACPVAQRQSLTESMYSEDVGGQMSPWHTVDLSHIY